MSTLITRSMADFDWRSKPGWVSKVPGDNGWCVRDAVCELLGWPCDSENWRKFTVEGPEWHDTERLAQHLDLTIFSISASVPQEYNELITKLEHPGVALFLFEKLETSHVVYIPDLRWLLHHWPGPDGKPATGANRHLWRYGWPLSPEHMQHEPVRVTSMAKRRDWLIFFGLDTMLSKDQNYSRSRCCGVRPAGQGHVWLAGGR